jgi:hypothetical protein
MSAKYNYQPVISVASAFVLIAVFTFSSLATSQSAAPTANTVAASRAEPVAGATSRPASNNTDLTVGPASGPQQIESPPAKGEETAQEESQPASSNETVVPVSEASNTGDTGESEAPMASLTARGRVTVDGSFAKTGTTILTGSTISTGPDGDAIVDMGALGRLEVGPNTSVSIVLTHNKAEVRPQCGHTRVTVVRGKTTVRSGSKTTLSQGQETIVDGPVTLTAANNDEVIVACTDTPANTNGTNTSGSGAGAGGTVFAGKIGVFALLGASGLIAAAVVTHGFQGSGSTAPPEASPIQR